jgi:hypothetical protein
MQNEAQVLSLVLPVTLLLIAELVFAIFVFRLSKVVSFVLFGLMVFQIAATLLLLTPPKPPVSWELGGADLGAAIIGVLGFWISVLGLAFCVLVSVGLLVERQWRKKR